MSNNPLFARLVLMFGPAPSDDPQAYIAELLKLTRGYAAPELDRAADLLIRTHNPTHLKPWPTPADIVSACADAREMLEPNRGDSKPKDQNWTAEALKAADRLMQSDIGRTAADHGYALGLWDFYRKSRRQPTPDEVSTIRRESKEFDHAYGSIPTRGLGPKLRALGDTMLARRQEKADLAHGVISDRAEIAKQMLSERSKAMSGDQ